MNCICCDSANAKKSPATLAPFVSMRVYGRAHACYSVQCQDCGALFSDTRFNDEQARKLYAGYRDAQYMAERMKYEPGYSNPPAHNYVAEIEVLLELYLIYPHTLFSNILDWGGGDGSNTPFRKFGRAIYDIATQPNKPIGKYELVVCSNLLEHVAYPVETLEEIKPHIGHILYLEIPMGPVTDRAYLDKTEWHEHITFFTEKSVEMLLRRAGLDVVGYRKHELTGAKYYTHLLMLACKKG